MWPPGAVADSTAHCTEPRVSKCKFTSPRASEGTIHGRIVDCSDPVLKVCGAHLIRAHDDISGLPLPDKGRFFAADWRSPSSRDRSRLSIDDANCRISDSICDDHAIAGDWREIWPTASVGTYALSARA